METERDHVLDRKLPEEGLDDFLLEDAQRQKDNPDVLGDELPFETLEAVGHLRPGAVRRRRVRHAAPRPAPPRRRTSSACPGCWSPTRWRTLLRKRQADQLRPPSGNKRRAAKSPQIAPHELIADLRKELNGLVGAWNHRTGQPHGVIHAELRRACGGPAIAQASAEQIQERIGKIRQWATQRSH